MDDSVPVNDPNIERSVLCSMLRHELSHYAAIEMLKATDFYVPAHGVCFSWLEKHGPDAAMLMAYLKSQYGPNDGFDLMNGILSTVCSNSKIVNYCNELLRLKSIRMAHQSGVEVSSGDTTDQIVERLHNVADEIRAKAPAMAVNPVKAMYDELDLAVSGTRYAAPLPWEMLDLETRALLPGTVTILCGSPGATKSLAAIQLIRHLRKKEISACILELEDGVSYHLRRAAAQVLSLSDLTDDGWCRGNPEKIATIKNILGPQLEELRRSIEAPADANRCSPDELLAWVRAKARNHRVIAIDPITMMVRGKSPWSDDERFLFGAKRIIEESGSSLILVTHPRKMPFGASKSQMSMDDLSGGVSYSRFSQSVLFLQAHEDKDGTVERANGATQDTYNRTMVVFKARNGRGCEGRRYAFQFDAKSLTLNELGRLRRDA